MKYLEAFLSGDWSQINQNTPSEELTKPPKPVLSVLSVSHPVLLGEKTPSDQPKEMPPILPGWVVSYRGASGLIEGGTVTAATPRGSGWTFRLSIGIELRDDQILSVGAVENGRWLGAWTVKAHGLEGIW